MAKSTLHSGVGARLVRLGAIAATAALGVSLSMTLAVAQSGKKAPPAKAPPPTSSTQSAWVKLCEDGQLTGKDKEGKELKKTLKICMTHHERIDGQSGMVLLSAALRQTQLDGQEKQFLRVTVPLGTMLGFGVGVAFLPKDIWDKVEKDQKVEKAEEEKVKSIRLPYVFCLVVGCTAEIEATPEILTNLKSGAGMVVHTLEMSGAPAGMRVPLAGFNQALAGAPTDTKKYVEARKALMQEIGKRQAELRAELQKQNQALQKMQGMEAHKGGAEPPAKAPPAKK
jgi:invasion protein IalB